MTNESGRFVLYYHGNLSPTLLPESVVRALRFLPDEICLRVVGYETSPEVGYARHLLEVSEQLRVRNRVEIMTAVPRRELLEICKSADVGIASVPPSSSDINLNALAGASNKVFDYMACGLALLVPEAPEWEEMFVRPGYAVSCQVEETEAVSRTVLWLYQNRDRVREMGNAGRRRILDDWNYETQFSPVLPFLV
ncbi:MAG: glycosyltransferase [Acidobacteriota bacterium]|nr:glycosyltransferase [Acidobacteriota bacterium]